MSEPEPNWEAFFTSKDMMGQTDRGIAIIGSAYVETLLRRAVQSRLAVNDDITEKLVAGNRPLISFFAITQLGYALGLYGPSGLDDLDQIRVIRNRFAHRVLMPTDTQQMRPVSFETKEIKELCNQLVLPQTIHTVDWSTAPKSIMDFEFEPVPSEPKEQFLRALKIFEHCLIGETQRDVPKLDKPKLIDW